MMETYLAIEGLDALSLVDGLDERVQRAVVRALNRVADKTRTRADRAIREQVNFPASYLRPNSNPRRLYVSKKASSRDYESIVTGRGRATSLARFTKQKPLASGRSRHPRGQVRVRVKRGGAQRVIPRAFLMRLNNDNLGLAVRTDGSAPRGSYKPKKIGKNLWLLYGPSVDQVLRAATDGRGVVEDLTPEILDELEREFVRLMKLDV